jgi:hypothetical protein
MKFHRSNMKTERLVRKSLRSIKTLKNYKFLAKFGPKKQKLHFLNLMRARSRSVPMKFHRSNMKTERLVCKSLRSVKNLKKLQVFSQNRA